MRHDTFLRHLKAPVVKGAPINPAALEQGGDGEVELLDNVDPKRGTAVVPGAIGSTAAEVLRSWSQRRKDVGEGPKATDPAFGERGDSADAGLNHADVSSLQSRGWMQGKEPGEGGAQLFTHPSAAGHKIEAYPPGPDSPQHRHFSPDGKVSDVKHGKMGEYLESFKQKKSMYPELFTIERAWGEEQFTPTAYDEDLDVAKAWTDEAREAAAAARRRGAMNNGGKQRDEDYWYGGMKRLPEYRRRVDFVRIVEEKHGGAVADQAAAIIGVGQHRDRFMQNHDFKDKEPLSDQNPNALRYIAETARRLGLRKLSGKIERFLAATPRDKDLV